MASDPLLTSVPAGLRDQFSSSPVLSILVTILTASVIYQFGTLVYNLFFHPLRKFPGPTLCAASKLPLVYNMLTGRSHVWNHNLHLKYGPVIREAPNRLSYTDERGWKDIYGFKKPAPYKDPMAYGKPPNEVPGMLTADDEPHARMRRIFANAFSDKALKEQEPLFLQYANLLVEKLREAANTGPEVPFDMVRMLNFTTFDIMAELTFAESLGLLERTEFTPWASMIFKVLRAGTYVRVIRMFPIFDLLLKLWLPTSLRKIRDDHFKYSSDRVDKRLEAKMDRPDIWGLVLRQQELGRGLSLKEMHTNAALFMGAGTETTATELSGLLYFLLTNPEKMDKLVREIRTAFQTNADMHMEQIARLEYLQACLEESLRLYPPVPIGLPRVVRPSGAQICGDFIPGGCTVAVTQYATYRSPANFSEPNAFIPERWTPDPQYASDVKGALQPFSYGPRNCLGKNMAYHEMRLLLTKLLWHFDFELAEESRGWAEKQRVFALWEKKPLMVTLTIARDRESVTGPDEV